MNSTCRAVLRPVVFFGLILAVPLTACMSFDDLHSGDTERVVDRVAEPEDETDPGDPGLETGGGFAEPSNGDAANPPDGLLLSWTLLRMGSIQALQILVMVACGLLIYRTSRTTGETAFLRRLAGAYACLGIGYTLSLVPLAVEVFNSNGGEPGLTKLAQVADYGVVLSTFCASLFVFSAAYLLLTHPRQRLPRSLVRMLLGTGPALVAVALALGTGAPAQNGAAEAYSAEAHTAPTESAGQAEVGDLLVTLIMTAAVISLGWQVYRTARRQATRRPGALWMLFRFNLVIAFGFWASLQFLRLCDEELVHWPLWLMRLSGEALAALLIVCLADCLMEASKHSIRSKAMEALPRTLQAS